MRRMLLILAILAAILAGTSLTYGLMLAMDSRDTGTPTTTPSVPAGHLPQISPTSGEYLGERIEVVAETVNLRDDERHATGMTISQGEILAVSWTADGYGEIIEPTKFAGLFIWRGCTSDPADYGCEAK